MKFLGLNVSKEEAKETDLGAPVIPLVSPTIASLVVVLKQIVDQLDAINAARQNESASIMSEIQELSNKKDFVDGEAVNAATAAKNLIAAADSISQAKK